MTADSYRPDSTLDLRMLRCPNLLITVIEAVEQAQPGQIFRICARDLNAPSSISSWTRQSGNTLLDMYEENEDFIFVIQRQPVGAAQSAAS